MTGRELAVHALASLDRLRPPGTGDDVWAAAADTAGAAADLLAGGSGRAALLDAARAEGEPGDIAAAALAAALCDAEPAWVLDAAATFAAIASGIAGAVPGVALDGPGSGSVQALLEGSDPAPDAARDHRLAELYVAGTLVRASAREVPLQAGLDALAAVEAACAEIDAIDVDDLLRHVYGDVAIDDERRPALAGGALALNVLPRVTGGVLNRDVALQHKGWTRAAALLATLTSDAGVGPGAPDVRATAGRLASDPTLLGNPDATITDLLATGLGLQAAAALGGVAEPGPAAHLLARLVAWSALTR